MYKIWESERRVWIKEKSVVFFYGACPLTTNTTTTTTAHITSTPPLPHSDFVLLLWTSLCVLIAELLCVGQRFCRRISSLLASQVVTHNHTHIHIYTLSFSFSFSLNLMRVIRYIFNRSLGFQHICTHIHVLAHLHTITLSPPHTCIHGCIWKNI